MGRIFWLYGLHTLLANAAFLVGFYLLPEGALRGSPPVAVGRVVAGPDGFWGPFALTLLFNIGWGVLLTMILNLNRVRGFPAGYLIPIVAAIVSGLVLGTNSFAADDLSRYHNAREALALGLTIGGLEMLAYVVVAAATVGLGVYEYRSVWRWSGAYSPTRTMRLRDVRLRRSELMFLVIALAVLVVAAYRESSV